MEAGLATTWAPWTGAIDLPPDPPSLLLHLAWPRAQQPHPSHGHARELQPSGISHAKALQSPCRCSREICILHTHTSTWFVHTPHTLLEERAQAWQPLQADSRRQCDSSFVHRKRRHCQDSSLPESGSRRPIHVAGKGHPTTMPSRHQVKSSQVKAPLTFYHDAISPIRLDLNRPHVI